jgi:hypothetical protein
MAFDEAVIGGAFALAGVGLQQMFTLISDKRRAYADRVRTLQSQRVSLYTRVIADARRVQRALKDSTLARQDQASIEDRLRTELERLAESVAAVRLFASPTTSKAVERFEDTARSVARRPRSERSGPEADLCLGPLIETLQRELGPHGPSR